MDKSQLKRGMWVTINAGPLKGGAGRLQRVDQKKSEVLVQIDGGLVTNTFKTYRISWDDVTLIDLSDDYYRSPAMILLDPKPDLDL